MAVTMAFALRSNDGMDAGLTRLSDAELTQLRERVVQITFALNADQRAAASARLAAIDLERERRLAIPVPLIAP